MSTEPIVKSHIENDGGSRAITAEQVATSPTTVQFIPKYEGEEFSLPSADPGTLEHQPLVVVVNGSIAFGLRLKVEDGLIHPEGTIDIPPDRSALLLATQRGLQGTDWTLVNPAQYGDTVIPGLLRLESARPSAELIIRRTDGQGRAHIYWNTKGGNSPKFEEGNEDAMKLTLHGSALIFDAASGFGQAAGDPITWNRELEVGGGQLTVRGRDLVSELDALTQRVTALESAAS